MLFATANTLFVSQNSILKEPIYYRTNYPNKESLTLKMFPLIGASVHWYPEKNLTHDKDWAVQAGLECSWC